jgi:hypothetical protein
MKEPRRSAALPLSDRAHQTTPAMLLSAAGLGASFVSQQAQSTKQVLAPRRASRLLDLPRLFPVAHLRPIKHRRENLKVMIIRPLGVNLSLIKCRFDC